MVSVGPPSCLRGGSDPVGLYLPAAGRDPGWEVPWQPGGQLCASGARVLKRSGGHWESAQTPRGTAGVWMDIYGLLSDELFLLCWGHFVEQQFVIFQYQTHQLEMRWMG